MKKLFLAVALITALCLTGCGSLKDKEIKDNFIKDVEGLKAYYMEGTLRLTNNDDTYEYDVEVSFKKDDKYKVSLKNKSNDYEQIILKNDEGVYVITPSLNKSFKFQSDWPNNNSQSYLLDSVAKDLKDDSAYKFTQKDKDYIFTTKTNYPNNPKYVKQNITLDKNQKLKKVEVQDEQGRTYIEFNVSKIDNKAKFDDNQFNLDELTKNFAPAQDNQKNQTKNQNQNNSFSNSVQNNNTENTNANLDEQSNTSEKPSTDQNTNSDNQTTNQEQKNNQTNSNDNSQNNNTSTTSKIDENVFPLYLPTNTSLSDKEVIETSSGQRVIMTFSGDNPFVLVEETIKPSENLEIIPTYGEPFMLIDTVGSLTDTSYTWTSNGVEYYIVSDQMNKHELLEVAKSINVVSAINQK